MRTDGDRFELGASILLSVGFALLGLAIAVAGVLVSVGILRPTKGKPLALGVLMAVTGVAIAFVCVAFVSYERLVVTPTEFRQATGFLGRDRTVVPLDESNRLVLYRARFPRDSPRYSIGRKNYTFVEFCFPDRESVHMRMRGPGRARAVEHLVGLAVELGLPIEDRREETPRFRVHTPFGGTADAE